MSREKFDPNCKGCLPVLIDAKTGQIAPENEPALIALRRVWRESDLATKEAWHRFTCHNSRTVQDVALVQAMMAAFEKAAAS